MNNPVKRWLGWLALVIAFSVACVFLSNWQFDRRSQAANAISQLDTNYSAEPVDLSTLERPWGLRKENEWRPVRITGHYLVNNAMLIRNRPLDGSPGFLIVIPFQLSDLTLVLVERGWVAADSDYNPPKQFALPSANQQTIEARIRVAESQSELVAENQLGSINPVSLAKAQGIKDRIYLHIYLRMSAEERPGVGTPHLLSKPQLDEGNHLSYALQWILFALMAVAALIWAIRKEQQARAGLVRIKRKDKDASYEDSQLD